MSNQDIRAFCDWAIGIASSDDLVTYACYSAARTAAGDNRDRCEELARDCIADSDRSDLHCMLDEDLTRCASQITMGQLESCTVAQVEWVSEVALEISCDSAPEDVDPAELDRLPVCALIAERCPGF